MTEVPKEARVQSPSGTMRALVEENRRMKAELDGIKVLWSGFCKRVDRHQEQLQRQGIAGRSLDDMVDLETASLVKELRKYMADLLTGQE
jgi:hypothetical protein